MYSDDDSDHDSSNDSDYDIMPDIIPSNPLTNKIRTLVTSFIAPYMKTTINRDLEMVDEKYGTVPLYAYVFSFYQSHLEADSYSRLYNYVFKNDTASDCVVNGSQTLELLGPYSAERLSINGELYDIQGGEKGGKKIGCNILIDSILKAIKNPNCNGFALIGVVVSTFFVSHSTVLCATLDERDKQTIHLYPKDPHGSMVHQSIGLGTAIPIVDGFLKILKQAFDKRKIKVNLHPRSDSAARHGLQSVAKEPKYDGIRTGYCVMFNYLWIYVVLKLIQNNVNHHDALYYAERMILDIVNHNAKVLYNIILNFSIEMAGINTSQDKEAFKRKLERFHDINENHAMLWQQKQRWDEEDEIRRRYNEGRAKFSVKPSVKSKAKPSVKSKAKSSVKQKSAASGRKTLKKR
jgi:hypothetical protein